MHLKTNYITLLIFFVFIVSTSAQEKWQTKGILYSDKDITVEIEYQLAAGSCDGSDNLSSFRYRIVRLSAVRDFYINWRFDFFNCKNELKTQLNSLHVRKQTKTGFLEPTDNSFVAKKMSNYLNQVRRSAALPPIGSYQPISSLSLPPIAIKGRMDLAAGESTVLTLEGGNLAKGAVWEWYDGSCGGRLIGTGTNLKLVAKETMWVFVRAVGSSSSECMSVLINVKQGTIAPLAVLGKREICEGEKNITLSVSGGKLTDGAKWVWYAGSCAGLRLGEGESILISPSQTTNYFVRAEKGDEVTSCQVHQVVVNKKSGSATAVEGLKKVSYGGSLTLKVGGGYLAPGAKWVWYKGGRLSLIQVGVGTVFSTGALYADEIFSVRAEGPCNETAFVTHQVLIEKKMDAYSPTKKLERTTFFVNGGLVFTEASAIDKADNYVVTIGGGKKIGWFLRAKIGAKNSRFSFYTDADNISNYSRPGYYEYNGEVINKRNAYTGGFYLGGKAVSIYFGGGYGSRELLWGINQYSYGNEVISTNFAKNTSRSFEGAEVEMGVLIRLGFLNLMGGASSIRLKYTDFNIGVGFNL